MSGAGGTSRLERLKSLIDPATTEVIARVLQPYQLNNGTIITEIDTEYFLVFGDDRHQFVGVNYCPFCGRVLSRELWNLEKKKQ